MSGFRGESLHCILWHTAVRYIIQMFSSHANWGVSMLTVTPEESPENCQLGFFSNEINFQRGTAKMKTFQEKYFLLWYEHLMWDLTFEQIIGCTMQYCYLLLRTGLCGNGDPLQSSCLENPRDGGAWWAAIYGVAQSRTWLMRPSSSSSNSTGLCCVINL